MNQKFASLLLCGAACFLMTACQPSSTTDAVSVEINDSNTPLHLMQPDYVTPYGIPTVESIKVKMDLILNYLEECTPARIVDAATGAEVTDWLNLPDSARLHQGDFRLTSYEWGVTYAAMVAAAEATGDAAYRDYMSNRINMIATVMPHFQKVVAENPRFDQQMRRVVAPSALDDAGAMASALIRLQLSEGKSDKYVPLIENYVDYIMNKEYRLADGTFARRRPRHNTVWLDDMYMGIPALAW